MIKYCRSELYTQILSWIRNNNDLKVYIIVVNPHLKFFYDNCIKCFHKVPEGSLFCKFLWGWINFKIIVKCLKTKCTQNFTCCDKHL